jgi:plasmid stabilization system protein ParE
MFIRSRAPLRLSLAHRDRGMIVYAPRALRDIEEILDWTAQKSPKGAHSLSIAIGRAIGVCEAFPRAGARTDEPAVYRWPIDIHLGSARGDRKKSRPSQGPSVRLPGRLRHGCVRVTAKLTRRGKPSPKPGQMCLAPSFPAWKVSAEPQWEPAVKIPSMA